MVQVRPPPSSPPPPPPPATYSYSSPPYSAFRWRPGAAAQAAILESRRAANFSQMYYGPMHSGLAPLPPYISSALLLRSAYTRDYIRTLGAEVF
eukprot:m.275711 g.275711  ORF g.275711 m.275711 type:complete len:94 (+) comp26905_c3_seq1:97-378(+)